MSRKKLAAALFAALVVILVAACSSPTACEEYPDLCGSGAGGPGGGGAAAGGGGGEGGNIDPGCDASALPMGTAIAPTCGLFVDAAATGNEAGTQAEPFHSLTAALSTNPAPTQAIYVCRSPLDEAVTLSIRTTIFGGLDCAGWTTTAEKTPWTAPQNLIPLQVQPSAAGARLARFAVTARDAAGSDMTSLQGNSSITALVDGAELTLEDLDLVAGQGAGGDDGQDQAGQAPGRQSAPASFDGNTGGGCGMPAGMEKIFMSCPAGGQTIGGGGGNGGQGTGLGGGAGSPDPGLGEPNGTAGLGDTGAGGWDCGADGGTGEMGHSGPTGPEGPGGTALGTLSASGYAGAAGTAGTAGTIGQGGGGGGGRRGNGQNGCGAGVAGPAGGSGGAGGCGGLAGGAGGAGGASIALVSLGATLTLTRVTLTAGPGGQGGAGGDGQLGGNGGNGGNGGGNACTGGAGGNGGNGGPGGGGRGGHSIGLAFTGAEPVIDAGAITVAAAEAQGGPGGLGGSPATQGAAGLLAPTQAF
jgi:hypothetical protein